MYSEEVYMDKKHFGFFAQNIYRQVWTNVKSSVLILVD